MPNLAHVYFRTAILFLIAGISVGIYMSISGNHAVTGAHAHINLLGWVTSALFGTYLALNPAKYLVLIACIEVGCMVLFLVPRTALLGAVLTTGLLGASLAANLRVDNPLFSHTLFSIYLGTAVWVALWLREERVRAVFPLVR